MQNKGSRVLNHSLVLLLGLVFECSFWFPNSLWFPNNGWFPNNVWFPNNRFFRIIVLVSESWFLGFRITATTAAAKTSCIVIQSAPPVTTRSVVIDIGSGCTKMGFAGNVVRDQGDGCTDQLREMILDILDVQSLQKKGENNIFQTTRSPVFHRSVRKKTVFFLS